MFYFGLHWNQHMRVAPSIILTDEQKNELTRLSRSGRTSVRLAERSRIVLLAAQGLQNKEIAEQLGVGRPRYRLSPLACTGSRVRPGAIGQAA